MSSYGTAVVIDVPSAAEFDTVVGILDSQADEVYALTAGDGWRRATAYLEEPGVFDDLAEALGRMASARAVFAEDFDEYGALWAVIRVDGGRVQTVHRRYVLNADPDDPDELESALEDLDEDPRVHDVAGELAAAAAAELFGVDPTAVVAAEQESASAYTELGVVGGPFPWWDAMGLPWPEPGDE